MVIEQKKIKKKVCVFEEIQILSNNQAESRYMVTIDGRVEAYSKNKEEVEHFYKHLGIPTSSMVLDSTLRILNDIRNSTNGYQAEVNAKKFEIEQFNFQIQQSVAVISEIASDQYYIVMVKTWYEDWGKELFDEVLKLKEHYKNNEKTIEVKKIFTKILKQETNLDYEIINIAWERNKEQILQLVEENNEVIDRVIWDYIDNFGNIGDLLMGKDSFDMSL